MDFGGFNEIKPNWASKTEQPHFDIQCEHANRKPCDKYKATIEACSAFNEIGEAQYDDECGSDADKKRGECMHIIFIY